MSSPHSTAPDRYSLLLDFPVRLYTAIRTIRLYPASNPQVHRSNDFAVKAFKALLKNQAEGSVNLAFSEGKIIVCGEHLPDKDQTRPQIQGLITLFSRLRVHSFTFHPNFSFDDCATFIHTLSTLLGEKELAEPMSVLLEKAGIASVSVDIKRYVAIREGEQVVRDELIGSGLNISDEELANFVLGRTEQDPLQGISPELVQELIDRLPVTGEPHLHSEDKRTNVIDFLRTLSKETDFRNHYDEIEKSARALSGIDPSLLAKLMATLPATPAIDAMLGSTLHQLSPQQLNTLISNLVAQLSLATAPGRSQDPAGSHSLLNRLACLEKEREPDIKKVIAQNIDARQLLLTPDATLAQLPEHLLQRLKQPEWSATVLATAAQQVVANLQIQAGGQIDIDTFNRMLRHYEQLLSKEQQTQVARQTGTQLASMGGVALGNILAQKFKGLFGEQLYSQVMEQVSDQLLDETVEHLTPKQLNRMIATLTSDIPLQIGKDKDPDFKPADDSVLKRLAQTRKGPEITRAIAQNSDARQMLLNFDKTLAQLPEHLIQRLKQPEWSARVLASAAQQVADPQIHAGSEVDFNAFNRMLGHYEQLLSKEQQTQVARQAGTQMASMEGVALGNILAQKFKGLFGEQLYNQVIGQVTDQLLDETVERLTPTQLNRMIATLTSDIPLQIGKDKDTDFKPADDSILKRLTLTRRGPEITKGIAQNIDARTLQVPLETLPTLPDQLAMRLQQPAWSTPILVAAARQFTDLSNSSGDGTNPSSFEHMLKRYDSLLTNEKQLQIATQVASQLATFDEKELGLLLVRKFKSVFGEQLYRQVISQLTEEKLVKMINHFQALAEGRDTLPLYDIKDNDLEEAYKRLQQTVRGEKMRAIVEMQRQQKKQREEKRQEAMKSSLDNLLQGDLKDLIKDDIHQVLPETIRNLLFENKEETADNLLMQLATALRHANPVVRKTGFKAMAAIGEQLAHIGQWERLEKLLPALNQGLHMQDINEPEVQQTMAALGRLTGHYITEERYALASETAHVLRILSLPDAAPGMTNPFVRQHALATLKGLCSQPLLEQLINLYLHSETHQEAVGKLLVEMGLESAKFQLQQLMSNESRFDRKRLLSLIKQTGNPALSILLEQLHKDSPWFVARNIIRLLGEIGNPALFATLKPFISHPDLRVQQEVINTTTKIGGENLNDFLLHALQTIDDSLKIRVVNHIADNHDERFVRPLTDLLEGTKLFPGKNKNDLQLAICKTLGAIGSRRATASLTRVVQSRNVLGLAGYSEEVRLAAGVAQKQIQEASKRQKAQDENEQHNPAALGEHASPPVAAASAETVAIREDAIFHLGAQGNRDQAKQELVDLNPTTAHARDLKTAERPGDRHYEIEGLTLGEVIRSGELIEQEKKCAINEDDLEIWSDLTDQLSTQEFQTMYHEFSERRCKPEETIVSQGDKNDALFFITQGSIKVSHLAGSRELFITSLNRGQIAGENFFAPSFWTVTLTSLTPSRIHILPQAVLSIWQEQFPELRAKLHAFYMSRSTVSSMLEKKGLERRKDQRFTLSRKIQVQPINTQNIPIGRGFRAETADISLGGLAFLVRISRQENARLLLGRRMQIVLPIGGKIKHLNLKGLVIGIQPFHILENDFAVHFKFDHPLEQHALQNILG